MFNMRLLLAVLVSLIFILVGLTYVTDEGYKKLIPKITEQELNAREKDDYNGEYSPQDLNDSEILSDVNQIDIDTLTRKKSPPSKPGAWSFKPLGSWVGSSNGKEIRTAAIKFDKTNYWLMVKDPENGNLTEKGVYDYQYNQVYFKPSDKRSYYMECIMISKNTLQLHGLGYSYNFERDDDLILDF